MFEVLCSIAKEAEKGTLTAIAAVDDDLEAFRIVDGEEQPATINVAEDPREEDEEDGVNWRNNEFIS